MNTKTLAQTLAAQNGRDWSDIGTYEREDYMDAARKRIDENYDGAFYCDWCKALNAQGCDCGQIADNN